MRRHVRIGLLALGVLGGYGWAFREARCHVERHRTEFAERLAQRCAGAGSPRAAEPPR